jgi:hypothetical protein
METVFKQAISRFGSILTPDKIIITDTHFTWEKRNKNLITKNLKSFDLSKITSVELDSSIWGTKIIIRTIAGDVVEVDKFTLNDAQKIKQLIEVNQNNIKQEVKNNHPSNSVDKILKLKELFDQGLIDEQEFNKLKKNIIP